MRLHRFVLLVYGLCLVCHSPLHAQFLGGIEFRSYETNQDERSSVLIPATGKGLPLRDGLTIEFDVRVREGADRFGYIARILIGQTDNLDIMLNNPSGDESFMCLIKNTKFLTKIHPDTLIRLDEWNRVKLELSTGNDGLYIGENGTTLVRDTLLAADRYVKIFFGRNTEPGFATTDVAPVCVRNLVVTVGHDKEVYEWPFSRPSSTSKVTDDSGKMIADVRNVNWMSAAHLCWKKVGGWRFSSKVFPVIAPEERMFYLVTENEVIGYRPADNAVYRYPFTPSLPVRMLSDQFVYDRACGGLVLYDFERPAESTLSVFDFEKKKWSVPVVRTREAANLHHSKFVSPIDTSIVQLFGYGFHKYLGGLSAISPSGIRTEKDLSDFLPPRYLSAVGCADSSLYIYGGVGNELGMQEYGIHVYNDLYRMNLADLSIVKIVQTEPAKVPETAASSLIVDEKTQSARALFFSPSRYQSYLVLKDIDLTTGKTTILADTIPYIFTDTESDADLIFDSVRNAYYAITVHKIPDGG